MENVSNYYAFIPSNVRYDSELSANAKLIYAEITAVLDIQGVCNLPNEYFCEMLNIAECAVKTALKRLKDRGYISITSEKGQNRDIRLEV